jgi:DMSO/TMAO reductase YedYZ molybdopterin-dependent catalytic subunit
MLPRPLRSVLLVALAALAVPASLLAQGKPVSPDVLLTVYGEGSPPLRLTAADLAKLPRRSVRAAEHGKEAAFEGVPLAAVLTLAGAPQGEALRGRQLALYLLVEARDGYRAVFALPELDSAFTEREILLADHRDGKPLSAAEGPLRVVVPGETRPARWVRQVTALRIERAPGGAEPGGDAKGHPHGPR